MAEPNSTYFLPTQRVGFLDLLFFHGALVTPVQLHDFARFVEDFVLSDVIYLPNDTHELITERWREDIPECAAILKPVGDLLDSIVLVDSNTVNLDELSRSELETELSNLRTIVQLKHLPFLYDSWRATETLYSRVIEVVDDPLAVPEDFRRYAASLHTTLDSLGLNSSPGLGYVPLVKPAVRPAKDLYATIAQQFGVTVARVEKVLGLRIVYLPPLLTILLDRTKSKDEFGYELHRLRADFAELRVHIRNFEHRLAEAKDFKDKIEIIEELDHSQRMLSKNLAARTQRSIVRRVWDVVKGGSIKSMVTAGLGELLDYDERRRMLRTSQRYIDLYELTTTVKGYEHLLEKVFGSGQLEAGIHSNMDGLARRVSVSGRF